MDREALEKSEFILELQAEQRDNPLKAATSKVKVIVDDINDNWPMFDMAEYNMTVVEHVPNGEVIMKFEAVDKDQVGHHFALCFKVGYNMFSF